tara:strand:+ start:5099 stop:5857 length:759 start_codon:yes stop_codon:yes gene_type:complete
MDKNICIITGSSGGIGESLVETYISDDYFVVGIDKIKNKNKIKKNFREILCDLNDFAKNEKYRAKIISSIRSSISKKASKLVLINNAGHQKTDFIEKLEIEDWIYSFNVNLFSPYLLIKELLDELENTKAKIINISSIHSLQTKTGFSAYASSKAALESLTRSLALELSPRGISVNAVSPAAIETDMLKESFENNLSKLDELSQFHPSNALGSTFALANFIKSITDHDSNFLTGTVLQYHGGISAKLSDPHN